MHELIAKEGPPTSRRGLTPAVFKRKFRQFDIELTSRCNLTCEFCPRAHTPSQGSMSAELLERALQCIVDYRHRHPDIDLEIHLSGNGDAMVHHDLAACLRAVSATGIRYALVSSGTLLTPKKSSELLDAGLKNLHLSISGLGKVYEQVYHYPFEDVVRNVKTFLDLAMGRCAVYIVVVQTHEVIQQWKEIKQFWRDLGIKDFLFLEEHNRAGLHRGQTGILPASYPSEQAALQILQNAGSRGMCALPFASVLVGWDGYYYLCSNEWGRRQQFGHINDTDIETVDARKQAFLKREFKLCNQCSAHPPNYIHDLLMQDKAFPPRTALPHFLEFAKAVEGYLDLFADEH